MKVGRVIARPFVGDPENGFSRTAKKLAMIRAFREPGVNAGV